MPAFYLRYPNNALRFTNHVGEQRNFCKQKCDVPFLVCLSNSTLSAQRSAYFFKTLYGTTFPHTARLHKFMNNQALPLRVGCRGCQPLHLDIFRYKVVNPTGERCSPLQIVPMVCCAAKSLSLFAGFTLYKDIVKAVQSFLLRHRFDFAFSLFFFYCFSAPLGRLAPIEALPQAPLRALP